jgi:hypothetical protein
VLLVNHRRGARTRPDDTRPRLTRSRIQSTRSVRPGRALVERVGAIDERSKWAPGGFFVIHPAYGRIGDAGGGGLEVIGYDPSTQRYWSRFFDSQGNASTSELRLEGEHWIWQREDTRCTAEFSADGKSQTAHHERRNEDGTWCPRWKWC